MEVSDDEQDEALLKLNEEELRRLQKVDSIQVIENMQISPKDASRFDILLCRMLYMPLVQSTLVTDIKKLEVQSCMVIALVHLFSMFPSAMRRGRSGL